jgi:phage baseplate assembly protein W
MVPSAETLLNQEIEFVEGPSRTFRLDAPANLVSGHVDGREAVRQAIYLILETERYRYAIFSWNYGVELEDLLGQPMSYVLPEIKRRVREALLQDTRITAVDGFEFDVKRGVVAATFTARTKFGDVAAGKAVTV